ncbi:hypothetical protein [Sphingomonas swuensis]
MRRFLLASVLLLGTSPAAAAWQEARTKHFIIYSEQKTEDLRAYAERLERYDRAVRTVRGMDDPALSDGGKVTIFVLPNVAAVQRLHSFSGSNVLGFYLGRAEGSVAFVPSRIGARTRVEIDADHVFQHEYMHHLQLSDQKSPLASWMVEGIAEFFGTAGVDEDGTVRIGAPPQVRGYMVLEDVGFTTEQLLTGQTPKNAIERESVYGKGWLLTHYLAFDKARAGQLTRYTTALGRGEKPLAAANGAFGDLKKLEAELEKYARGKFNGLNVPPGPKPEVTVRPVSEGQAAIMAVRMRSERGVDKSSAPGVASSARAIGQRYPGDPLVQGIVAEAEFDAKNYPAALAAADRALAADPNNVQAMIYKGRTLAAMAKEKGASADWAEVRRWFIRANRADTENAEPLYLFYQTFADSGQAPTASAKEGLYYAQALAPQDMGLRLAAVRQLLQDNKVAEAEPMFAAIAFNPHLGPSQQTKLAEVMALIRARDGKAALAMIEAEEKKAKEEAAKRA